MAGETAQGFWLCGATILAKRGCTGGQWHSSMSVYSELACPIAMKTFGGVQRHGRERLSPEPA